MISAAWFLLGVVVGIAFLAICNAWDRQSRPDAAAALDSPPATLTMPERTRGLTPPWGDL